MKSYTSINKHDIVFLTTNKIGSTIFWSW